MNDIITKDFHGSKIRLIIIDGKEWFFAKDIAEILGYLKTRNAITQHCKNAINFSEILNRPNLGQLDLQPFLGNAWKQIKIIPESDVWRLVVKSTLPEAQKVEKWIFEEVLPQIRKTGSYSISQPPKISIKQRTEDLEYAFKQYEIFETAFTKFGNLSKRELAEKTSNSVFQETGIDFLKMYGGFQKEVVKPRHSFKNIFSLTSLLEKYDIQIRTSKFNLKLEKLGIIERYGKSWKLLNLDFGINEYYKDESNPRYFDESFEELLKLVYPPTDFFEMPKI